MGRAMEVEEEVGRVKENANWSHCASRHRYMYNAWNYLRSRLWMDWVDHDKMHGIGWARAQPGLPLAMPQLSCMCIER